MKATHNKNIKNNRQNPKSEKLKLIEKYLHFGLPISFQGKEIEFQSAR